MKKPNKITVRTGTSKEFLENIKRVMRLADKGKPIPPSYTLVFEDPSEMLHFLTESKLHLINVIRDHPGSITEIANQANRNRDSVSRDINEMAKFGIVRIHDEINPGHGRHKIVEITASKLRLEAYI